MTYEEAIEYIHGIYWRGSKLGLNRTQELLGLLGNPQNSLKFVHVAGTNGKGSFCAMLASVLQQAGYHAGLYTSPYIRRFNERIQYDGAPISDEELSEITDYVSRFAESMPDKPTEFELVTAIGMEYFKRKQCDIVILEVGLGGTLDSTNVINTPEAAVITAIDYDHKKELGNTMESIASAKAGIIKQGGSVLFYGQNDAAQKVIAEKCAEEGACLTVADYHTLKIKKSGIEGAVFDYTIGAKNYRDLFVPLPGYYQVYNAALVLNAIAILSKSFPISEQAIREGLAQVKWPGRFELLCRKPLFIADGAHNPHGIRGTAESIAHHFPGKKIILIIGVMADKEIEPMLDLILPYVERAYTVTPPNPRAMEAEALAQKISSRGIHVTACGSVENGVKTAFAEASPEEILCSLGSLYMYGEIADSVRKYAPTTD